MRLFSNSPLSLRAKRGNLMPTSEIAELVPSETGISCSSLLRLRLATASAPRNDDYTTSVLIPVISDR